MKTKFYRLFLFPFAVMGFGAACSQEIPVSEIRLSQQELELVSGESARLEAAVLPENATVTKIQWSSSDENVATVDQDGTVKAAEPGEVVVSATAGSCTAVCRVTVAEPLPPVEAGQYFYEDGTWSEELDKDKTPIGVVFWAGDPTEYDARLKQDHPECVHGLVVSLKEESSEWQAAFKEYGKTVSDWVSANTELDPPISDHEMESPMNKIVGYNNTKAMEAFNGDDANKDWELNIIKKLVNYRSAVPVPETTSGWYLPSTKELSLLCSGEYEENIWDINTSLVDNKELINSRLNQITGAHLLGESFYWPSMEESAETVYILAMFNGAITALYKDNVLQARYILAF